MDLGWNWINGLCLGLEVNKAQDAKTGEILPAIILNFFIIRVALIFETH